MALLQREMTYMAMLARIQSKKHFLEREQFLTSVLRLMPDGITSEQDVEEFIQLQLDASTGYYLIQSSAPEVYGSVLEDIGRSSIDRDLH
ncbi:hypothetical protein, partial [Halioglobus sp. HI00S01]